MQGSRYLSFNNTHTSGARTGRQALAGHEPVLSGYGTIWNEANM